MLNQSFKEESVVYNFKIDSNNKDNFGHVFSGYLSIENPGMYEFRTISDDGSRLFIGSKLVVDNDGLHGKKIVTGSIQLKKDRYRLVVEYFERGGQEVLDVSWKGPGFEWQAIPTFLLFQISD